MISKMNLQNSEKSFTSEEISVLEEAYHSCRLRKSAWLDLQRRNKNKSSLQSSEGLVQFLLGELIGQIANVNTGHRCFSLCR